VNAGESPSASNGTAIAPAPSAAAPAAPAALGAQPGRDDQASRLRALVSALGQHSQQAQQSQPVQPSQPVQSVAVAGPARPVGGEVSVAREVGGVRPEVLISNAKPSGGMYSVTMPIGPEGISLADSKAMGRGILSGRPAAAMMQPARAPVMPAVAAMPARTAKLITIASGKGGVGKTMLAVNLAIALSQRHQRVTLLDADLGTANADLLCGLNPAARVEHVLETGTAGRPAPHRTLADIALDAPGGFKLVPGSVGLGKMADLSEPQRRRLVAGLRDLESLADVVLIDAAAGVGSLVTTFVTAADLTIVVATPEPTSIADAYALIKCASVENPMNPPPMVLVVNNARDQKEAAAVHARIDAVARRFLSIPIPLAGWIAHDPQAMQAVRARHPLLLRSPHSTASVSITRLAGAIARHFKLSPLAAIVPPNEPGALHRLTAWLAHFAS